MLLKSLPHPFETVTIRLILRKTEKNLAAFNILIYSELVKGLVLKHVMNALMLNLVLTLILIYSKFKSYSKAMYVPANNAMEM